MTTKRSMKLVDEAKISPSTVYEHPRQVVRSHVLTDRQKSDILEQWEADAIAMQTADAEGMTGGEHSRLDDVQKAQTELREITAGRGATHSQAGVTHNASDRDRRTVVSTREARQGVTGHNVRYVLAIGLAGVIVSFLLVAGYLSAT